MLLRVYFRDAPYIGPVVRNMIDADKHHCELLSTPPGVEIVEGGVRHLVPWSNVKSVVFA